MRPVRTVVLLLLASAAAAASSSCGRGPPPEPPALAAAEVKIAQGRWGEALRDLRGIPLVDLHGAGARLRAATVAAKARDFALAARILEPDARTRGRTAVPARMLRAEALLRSGDLERSREALTALEVEGFRTERWRCVYAMHCLARGEPDTGNRMFEELVHEGTKDPDALSRWAEAYPFRVGEALKGLREALENSEDPGAVQAALGACLLMEGRVPELARSHLEEAVRLRPFDRDALLNLARAWRARGGDTAEGRAADVAARILEQDPDDADARLLRAEAFGERGRLALVPGRPVPGPLALREWDRAEAEYVELLRRGAPAPSTTVRALQGLARIQVEEIALDPPGQATGPGTHYARAMEVLRRAEALDPEGRMEGGPHGARLIAETWYLRGRAARKAHTGSSDHTDALGWLRKAYRVDPRHLDASWDLGLLCHDFFPDSKEYQELAAEAFQSHVSTREFTGLPSLDAERMAIVEQCMARAGRKLVLGPTAEPLWPGPPPK